MHATKPPGGMKKSTSSNAARIAACRNRIGAPLVVTTRMPSTRLPTVLPFHTVSRIAG